MICIYRTEGVQAMGIFKTKQKRPAARNVSYYRGRSFENDVRQIKRDQSVSRAENGMKTYAVLDLNPLATVKRKNDTAKRAKQAIKPIKRGKATGGPRQSQGNPKLVKQRKPRPVKEVSAQNVKKTVESWGAPNKSAPLQRIKYYSRKK